MTVLYIMEKHFRAALLFTALMIVDVYANDTDNVPIVETKLGSITGIYKNISVFGEQMRVERYLGIPYAEAPIGDLRFRKPVAKLPFTETYHATQFGKTCYQIIGIFPIETSKFSEDCLFLNIFVPSRDGRHDCNQGNLPVMIFIHGGGFICGTGDHAIADTMVAYGNVIIVTINYRLTLWGFLSTGDEHAPGNYGLYDQHLAIRWVHDNIQSFGGDSQRVTIFGESAGGISVIFQAFFEGNDGLFQRVISESGTLTAPSSSYKQDAEKLGKLVGCSYTDSRELVKCLRTVPTDVLSATLNDFSSGLLGFPMAFLPTVDGDFVKEPLQDMLTGKTEISSAGRNFFSTIDLMAGMNAEEGTFLIPPVTGIFDLETLELNRTMYEDSLSRSILPLAVGSDAPDVIKDLIIHHYTDWTDPDDSNKRRHKLAAILADIFFSVSLIKTIAGHELISKGHKGIYMYMFDVDPSRHLLPTPSWLTRATHADELIYLFFEESGELVRQIPGNENYVPQPWEKEVARNMIDMWCNFAKTGNPNKPAPVEMFWPAYTKEAQQYLHITRDMNSDSVKSHFLAQEFNLWTKIIPAVKNQLRNDGDGSEHCERDSCQP